MGAQTNFPSRPAAEFNVFKRAVIRIIENYDKDINRRNAINRNLAPDPTDI